MKTYPSCFKTVNAKRLFRKTGGFSTILHTKYEYCKTVKDFLKTALHVN